MLATQTTASVQVCTGTEYSPLRLRPVSRCVKEQSARHLGYRQCPGVYRNRVLATQATASVQGCTGTECSPLMRVQEHNKCSSDHDACVQECLKSVGRIFFVSKTLEPGTEKAAAGCLRTPVVCLRVTVAQVTSVLSSSIMKHRVNQLHKRNSIF